jgi:aspartate 1-decarboxylase
MSFAEVEESAAAAWSPKVIVLDTKNQIINERGI